MTKLTFAVDPVVMKTVAMKDAGVPLAARIQEFPLLLLDLIFPFMMEYLVSSCVESRCYPTSHMNSRN